VPFYSFPLFPRVLNAARDFWLLCMAQCIVPLSIIVRVGLSQMPHETIKSSTGATPAYPMHLRTPMPSSHPNPNLGRTQGSVVVNIAQMTETHIDLEQRVSRLPPSTCNSLTQTHISKNSGYSIDTKNKRCDHRDP
jgi:hypothetical protein